MLLHSSPLFFIYFGSAQDKLFPAHYLNLPQQPILTLEPFSKLTKAIKAKHLFFAHQVHGDQGIVVDAQVLQTISSFKSDADFLVTNQTHAAIGVMTADCLPIVFHDKVHNAVAVAHAGWRGSVIGVAIKTIEKMNEEYGSQPKDITVYFGPSAKVCCYKVADDFADNLAGFTYADRVLQQHGQDWFFDLPQFNRIQLEAAGIKKEAFHLDYNICTMCDDSFYSHRLQGPDAGRQMTVACLT